MMGGGANYFEWLQVCEGRFACFGFVFNYGYFLI